VSARGEPAPDPGRGTEAPPLQAQAVFGAALPTVTRYVELLAGAGVERGLMGPHEPSRLWSRHVLNSAALAGLLSRGSDVLDLGSGAGLPGIPVALARPDLQVTLLEPMARRVAFLEEVVDELGLDIQVLRGRAEDVTPSSTDAVIARAVAPLTRLVPLSLPMLRPGGRLLALKGSTADAEIAAAKDVLRRWPLATVSVVTAPAGTTTATVVVIDMKDDVSPAKDRER
jgi:16S rRNA (guanine527-N7)-methyltransferase